MIPPDDPRLRLKWLWSELMDRQPDDDAKRLGDFAELIVEHGPNSPAVFNALGAFRGEPRELAELSIRLYKALNWERYDG